MLEEKKTKICIVGVGGTGTKILDIFAKTNSNDQIEYLSFAENYENSKFYNNSKIKTFDVSKSIKITLNELEDYCVSYNRIERMFKMLSIMKEGDELYKIIPSTSSCIVNINWLKIQLRRNDIVIDSFEVFFKELSIL